MFRAGMSGARPLGGTMNEDKPAIVVGVSGSEASAAALRWAADEARSRHATLRVVRSWDAEFTAPYAAGRHLTRGQQREAARAELSAQVRTALGSPCPAGVAAELAEGLAERTLVDRSAGAALLVLGSASPAAGTGRSIGPVVRACLRRAQCPVVVA
jgi:nucleotide-binding universal stress UspA family protein